MATIEESEIPFQQQETAAAYEPPGDFASFQFIPEKIVDCSILQDGRRSYCVKWKDSWLTEELIAIPYQQLINDFWSTTAANVEKTQDVEKQKSVKSTKASNIKIINKQDNYEPVSVHQGFQTSNITVTSQSAQIEEANLKDITESATTTHILDPQTGLLKQQVLSKVPTQTGINSNAITNIVVNSDVSLATYSTDHNQAGIVSTQPPLPPPPPPHHHPTIPKYQQALHQQITIEPQQLPEDEKTGKVTFPKHVFSQARYISKKQAQNLIAADQPRVSCEICQKSLKTKKMLWAHKVAVHFGGNFPCDICGKKCITGAELRRHKTSHSSERRFVCQYCGLAYKRWAHLYQHLRVHVEEKNFRCDVCHLNFKVQSELKDHCFSEHADGRTVQCSVCKHKLQTPLAVYHHSMKHTGTRDFLCEICGSNFKRKQHLVTHMKTHLTEKKGPDGETEVYNCQVCDNTFSLKMELKAHCEAAHPLTGKESAICKTCNKKLNVSHSVYLHGLRHCGAREFQCVDCNQMFKRKAHLLRHRMDRHPDEPKERKKRSVLVDPLACELCKKSFKYKTALIKHMISQHGIVATEDNLDLVNKSLKRPYSCDDCNKKLKSLKSLNKHRVKKHGYPNSSTDQNESKSKESDDDEDDDDSENEEKTLDETQKTTTSSTTDIMQGIRVDAAKQSGAIQVVSVDQFVNPTQGTPTNSENISRQVITLDEATGQIILLTSPQEATQQNIKKEAMESDGGKLSQSSEDIPTATASATATIMSVQNTANDNVHFDTQNTGALQSLNATSNPSQDVNPNQLQQVSIGQIIHQDGVTFTSVPIESVHGVNNGQNILDFGQGNSEQIVVLLSALNSDNLQQI